MVQSPTADGRVVLPAASRNREPILTVLRSVLPATGKVLEIASGTGQHAWYFAKQLPGLTWQPSDEDRSAFESIRAWQAHDPAGNWLDPIRVDVTDESWGVEGVAAMFCSNLMHIAPWPVTLGLMAGAGRLLPSGAPLVTYGAYRVGGQHTAPSNETFDATLRARDPSWGVRDLEAVARAAEAEGLLLEQRLPMPNHNFSLVFRRA